MNGAIILLASIPYRYEWASLDVYRVAGGGNGSSGGCRGICKCKGYGFIYRGFLGWTWVYINININIRCQFDVTCKV